MIKVLWLFFKQNIFTFETWVKRYTVWDFVPNNAGWGVGRDMDKTRPAMEQEFLKLSEKGSSGNSPWSTSWKTPVSWVTIGGKKVPGGDGKRRVPELGAPWEKTCWGTARKEGVAEVRQVTVALILEGPAGRPGDLTFTSHQFGSQWRVLGKGIASLTHILKAPVWLLCGEQREAQE